MVKFLLRRWLFCARSCLAYGLQIDASRASAPICRGLRLVILALVLALPLALHRADANPASPPPVVTVVTVQRRNVTPTYDFIGHVLAIQTVRIVPRVTAFIDKVAVRQGSYVKAGDVIFELQKAQYEAALLSAKAQLASAQAAWKNDQVAYERAQRLSHEGYEAQSALDAAIATRDQARASVQSAQAAVTQAALNLSYCTIRSPITGKIGAVTLTKGNLVTPTTAALATINQLNPIRVVFSVATTDLKRALQQVGWTPARGNKAQSVNLQLPDGSTYDQTGRISFFSNEVEQQTGTVPVYADFPNPKDRLLPGEYVSVSVHSAAPEQRLLVPGSAVQTDQKGSYVLTVDGANRVAQQWVLTGKQISQSFIVTKGLIAGERVIVLGVQKVQPGEVVRPVEAPPSARPNGQKGHPVQGE